MAAAAAGGERGWRGLRLTRGALSREARRRRGHAGDRGAAGHRLPATCRTMGSAEDAVKEKLLWDVKKEVRSGIRTRGLAPLLRCPRSGGSRFPRARPPAHRAGAGSCAGCAFRPSPRPGQRPRPGSSRRPGACLLRRSLGSRPVTAAARVDRGRGRGGGDCRRTLVAHSLPGQLGEGAGSPRASGGFETKI